MIIKLISKRSFILTAVISILTGMFTVIVRYDWALKDVLYNNFLFLHDDDLTQIGFQTIISVMNVILLFPFAMEMLTEHKSTNEVYIVSRMSDSAKFYFINYLKIILLCFAESVLYNLALLITYCLSGHIFEEPEYLFKIFAYTVFVNFIVALTFVSIMQLFEVITNEKSALVLIIILFCLSVILGFKLPDKLSGFWITNYYFITPMFSSSELYSTPFAVSLTMPAAAAFIISVAGSIIYKRRDHI